MQIHSVERIVALGCLALSVCGVIGIAVSSCGRDTGNEQSADFETAFEAPEASDDGTIEFVNDASYEGTVEFVSSSVTRSEAAKNYDVAGLVEFMNNAPEDTGVIEFVTAVDFETSEERVVEFVHEPVVSYSYLEAVANNTNLLTSEDILAHKYKASGETPIMGASGISLSQMVEYYKDRAKYPAFYADTDAPTLEIFCQMYIDECLAEGVRADVAFCQCMKETGFLRYGGSVSIEQFNFAGMGASGGGVKGITYGSVRQGIRAHVQHLKAFASTADMVNPPVDSRWSKVKRGSAVYVEHLGIGENPNHIGWATASRYGYGLMNDYVNVLSKY